MKQLIYMKSPCPPAQHGARLARLTRHLNARLLDFGPGGPEVLLCDSDQGMVAARFPGHETAQVISGLEARGFLPSQVGDQAVFYLSPEIRFEELDRLWGCLFELL